MIYAGKPKFCWLSASPYIVAGCFLVGGAGSGLPGVFGKFFACLAVLPLILIVLAAVIALALTLMRSIR